MLRGGVAGHGLLQFDADDERGPYAPERRSATAASVATLPEAQAASCRDDGCVPQPVDDGGGHRAEVALTRRTSRRRRCRRGRRRCRRASILAAARVWSTTSARQIGEVVAVAGEVAREVALIAAEDPDTGMSPMTRDGTTTKQSDSGHDRKATGGPAGSGLNRRDLGARNGRPLRMPMCEHARESNDKRWHILAR